MRARNARENRERGEVPRRPIGPASSPTRRLLLHAGLAILALAVYVRVPSFSFVGLDDGGYVYENRHVLGGLSWDGIRWAFTTLTEANWHPLTWLSLMLDATAGDSGPAFFHVTSLLLHVINTMLLFHLLARITGSTWKSAFVATLFGVHPLHVESVAWISERKDVLSTLFWLLCTIAYARYAERRGAGRYALVAALLALGLMAKPMLVTLPLVLLLLDFWPLGRITTAWSGAGRGVESRWAPFLDKAPLLALSAASSAVTLLAQSRGGAVVGLEVFPLPVRAANAVLSYFRYLLKAFWPTGLTVQYRYVPLSPTSPKVLVALVALIAVTFAVLRFARKRPYLAVGWLWFVITLVPVIGLVQVGAQAMADRYTYVPLVGIFIMVAWGVPDLLDAWIGRPRRKPALVAAGAAILVGLAVSAHVQAGHWRDGEALYRHAVLIDPQSADAQDGLGLELYRRGRTEEAILHYREALRLSPDYVNAHVNLASALARLGKTDEAESHYREALRLRFSSPALRSSLAAVLFEQGRLAEAADEVSKALHEAPEDATVHRLLGAILARQDRGREAAAQFEEALRIDPRDAEALVNLGTLRLKEGDLPAAESRFTAALEVEPDNVPANKNLGVILARQGRYAEAAARFEEVLRVDPGDEGARKNLERARSLAAGK